MFERPPLVINNPLVLRERQAWGGTATTVERPLGHVSACCLVADVTGGQEALRPVSQG